MQEIVPQAPELLVCGMQVALELVVVGLVGKGLDPVNANQL